MEYDGDKMQREIEVAAAIARLEVKLDTLCDMLESMEMRMLRQEERLSKLENQKVWGAGWVAGVAFVISSLIAFVQRMF